MKQKELFPKSGMRRVKLSLDASMWDAAGELAKRIGCSRSAVASGLLSHDLGFLSELPKRAVWREVVACRRVLGPMDRWKQKVILRARGPSMAYVSVVLRALLELKAGLGAGHVARK